MDLPLLQSSNAVALHQGLNLFNSAISKKLCYGEIITKQGQEGLMSAFRSLASARRAKRLKFSCARGRVGNSPELKAHITSEFKLSVAINELTEAILRVSKYEMQSRIPGSLRAAVTGTTSIREKNDIGTPTTAQRECETADEHGTSRTKELDKYAVPQLRYGSGSAEKLSNTALRKNGSAVYNIIRDTFYSDANERDVELILKSAYSKATREVQSSKKRKYDDEAMLLLTNPSSTGQSDSTSPMTDTATVVSDMQYAAFAEAVEEVERLEEVLDVMDEDVPPEEYAEEPEENNDPQGMEAQFADLRHIPIVTAALNSLPTKDDSYNANEKEGIIRVFDAVSIITLVNQPQLAKNTAVSAVAVRTGAILRRCLGYERLRSQKHDMDVDADVRDVADALLAFLDYNNVVIDDDDNGGDDIGDGEDEDDDDGDEEEDLM